MLPVNNNKYKWQTLFLVFSLGMMVVKADNFSFLAIILFVVPIAMDLIAWETNAAWEKVLRFLFICFNVGCALLGCFGQFGLIADKGDRFSVVDTSLLFTGFSIAKTSFAAFLGLDILVPVIMIFAIPTRVCGAVHSMSLDAIGGRQK